MGESALFMTSGMGYCTKVWLLSTTGYSHRRYCTHIAYNIKGVLPIKMPAAHYTNYEIVILEEKTLGSTVRIYEICKHT